MRTRNASSIYLFILGGEAFIGSLIFTALTVYYVTVVKMNPFQLVLVGTVLETAIVLCELPTGIVADTFSRRLSVIIGMFVLGGAFILEGSLPFVGGIFLAEAIRGIGHTFISGALDAWIAGEIGEDHIGALYLRGSQVSRMTGLVGTGASMLLGSIWIRWPVLVGGAIYVLIGLILVAVMPETNFEPTHETEDGSRRPLHSMLETVRSGARVVRGRPMLKIVLATSLFVGLFSEGFDRLWEAHFLTDLQFPLAGTLSPVVWFGIINVAGQGLSIIATEIFRRRVDTSTTRRTTRALLMLQTLSVGAIIGFALAPSFTVGLVLILIVQVLSGLLGPLAGAWNIQHTEPKTRATVLSVGSLLNAFGQTAGGPVVGAIGTYGSIRAALVTSGLLLSPLLALYSRVLRHEQQTIPNDTETVTETPL